MTECVHCQETITNPICPGCIGRAIKQWISFDVENVEVEHGEHCIICGKKMNLCSYCYTEDVYGWINDNHPELAEEFVDFFSFDLDKRGYAKLLNIS